MTTVSAHSAASDQARRHFFASSHQRQNFSEKIQSIYNGKCAPITMQGLARPLEKSLAQKQWETMEKTMCRATETVAMALRARRCQVDRVCSEGMRMSLGAQRRGQNFNIPPLAKGAQQ